VVDRPSHTGSGFGEFVPEPDALPSSFELLVPGEFGGKARGLMYPALMLDRGLRIAGEHTDRVRIPPSALLGTDLFDAVVERNDLAPLIGEEAPGGGERAVYDAFLAASLPGEVRERLREYLSRTTVPLAVRSSSLQEDNFMYSFSGIYRTRFVSNTGTPAERLAALEHAIRVVLGSTFLPRARVYRRRHGLGDGDEKMAVLVQHLVGRRRGGFFFPLVGGVGFSHNMYPWTDRISVEDGVVRLVYGLGTRAVDRDYARVFVPSHPRLRPEGFSVEAIEQYAQERFDAIVLDGTHFRRGIPLREIVPVEGNDLHLAASLVREGEFLRAPRLPLRPDERFVVTFDEMIAGRTSFPLVPVVRALFDSLSMALGTPVDIEFAATATEEEQGGVPEHLHLLQVRPLGVRASNRPVAVDPGGGRVFLRSSRVMGNGVVRGIRRAILVLAEEYDAGRPDRAVREIRRLDRELEGEPYLLVGPGRWGSTNPAMGVPVGYEIVSGAVAIVEVAAGSMAPEVSYGTHFFGDLLSSGVHYLTVVPDGGGGGAPGDLLDAEWLLAHASEPRGGVRLVEFPSPATLQVDGIGRRGIAFVTPGGKGRGNPDLLT